MQHFNRVGAGGRVQHDNAIDMNLHTAQVRGDCIIGGRLYVDGIEFASNSHVQNATSQSSVDAGGSGNSMQIFTGDEGRRMNPFGAIQPVGKWGPGCLNGRPNIRTGGIISHGSNWPTIGDIRDAGLDTLDSFLMFTFDMEQLPVHLPFLGESLSISMGSTTTHYITYGTTIAPRSVSIAINRGLINAMPPGQPDPVRLVYVADGGAEYSLTGPNNGMQSYTAWDGDVTWTTQNPGGELVALNGGGTVDVSGGDNTLAAISTSLLPHQGTTSTTITINTQNKDTFVNALSTGHLVNPLRTIGLPTVRIKNQAAHHNSTPRPGYFYDTGGTLWDDDIVLTTSQPVAGGESWVTYLPLGQMVRDASLAANPPVATNGVYIYQPEMSPAVITDVTTTAVPPGITSISSGTIEFEYQAGQFLLLPLDLIERAGATSLTSFQLLQFQTIPREGFVPIPVADTWDWMWPDGQGGVGGTTRQFAYWGTTAVGTAPTWHASTTGLLTGYATYAQLLMRLTSGKAAVTAANQTTGDPVRMQLRWPPS